MHGEPTRASTRTPCHQVRLASVFGLLTFLLNYIPNVGSMIAMLLPIPVIYVDDELSPATVTL